MEKILILLLLLSSLAQAQFITDTAKCSTVKGSYAIRLTKVLKGSYVGMDIIITNKGIRGQEGVNNWPAKIYTTLAQMAKDTFQVNKLWAGVKQDSGIYRYDKDFTTWNKQIRMEYYLEKFLPLSLNVKVVRMSADKRTFYIDKPAAISTKAAVVYADNASAIEILARQAMARPEDVSTIETTINLPAGRIAIGRRIDLSKIQNLNIKGAGKEKTILFSPDGSPSLSFEFVETQNLDISGIAFLGNMRENGFGFSQNSEDEGGFSQTGWTGNAVKSVPGLLIFGKNTWVHDCRFVDNFYAWQASGVNMHFTDNEVIHTDYQRTYTSWPVLMDGCDETSSVEDVTFSFPKMSRALEIFKGYGKIRNVRITNGYIAANSGAIDIDSLALIITPKSYNPYLKGLPLVDINQRIEPNAARTGGLMQNVVISNNDPDNLYRGVLVAPGSKNVTIRNFTYFKGNALDKNDTPAGIVAEADGLVLDNVQIYGNLGTEYTSVYADPNHASIGLVGDGIATLSNIKAQFVSWYNRITVNRTEIQAQIIIR